MSAKKLPEIRPCPRGCGGKPKIQDAGAEHDVQVVCPCGWMGPAMKTESGAINAWSRRAKDAAQKPDGEVYEALGFLIVALENMKVDGKPAAFSPSVKACMSKARRALDNS